MTNKTVHFNASGQPTKPEGWFSWRHKTRDAHDEAPEKYRDRANGRPRQSWDDDAKQWVKYESAQQRLLRAIYGEVAS